MNTRQISIPIQGMFCARCASQIESALTGLNGVVAAQVNYASERATVIYDSSRVLLGSIVDAIERAGFHVPLESFTITVRGLVYATRACTVEQFLSRTEGIVKASANPSQSQVRVLGFAGGTSQDQVQDLLDTIGYERADQLQVNAVRGLVLRGIVLLAAVIGLVTAAWLNASQMAPDWRLLNLLGLVGGLVTFSCGYPLYQHAFAALRRGLWDDGVVLAVTATTLLVVSLVQTVLGFTLPWLPWSVWGAVLLASASTGEWFITQIWALWVLMQSDTASRATVCAGGHESRSA